MLRLQLLVKMPHIEIHVFFSYNLSTCFTVARSTRRSTGIFRRRSSSPSEPYRS